MKIPNEEFTDHHQETPPIIPLNSTAYSGGHSHMIHHLNNHQNYKNHNIEIIPSSNSTHINISPPNNDPNLENNNNNKNKLMVKYRECLKNHAASMGGNATDGCGEFMPSGNENTLEALTCSACNCHRNFHRKEFEGQSLIMAPRSPFLHHHHNPYKGNFHHRHIVPHHHMLMQYDHSDYDYHAVEDKPSQLHHQHDQMMMKKRHRTKFSKEQKDKMLEFAEKVGWKIQKHEEGFVQQFCQEVGVKRRVLKVWMHNNKHSLNAKKNNITISNINA